MPLTCIWNRMAGRSITRLRASVSLKYTHGDFTSVLMSLSQIGTHSTTRTCYKLLSYSLCLFWLRTIIGTNQKVENVCQVWYRTSDNIYICFVPAALSISLPIHLKSRLYSSEWLLLANVYKLSRLRVKSLFKQSYVGFVHRSTT